MVRRRRSAGRRRAAQARPVAAPASPGVASSGAAGARRALSAPAAAAPGAAAAPPAAPDTGGGEPRLAMALALQRRLNAVYGISMSDPSFLERALTHPSFAHERQFPAEESNQRLEFLGDAVVGLIVCEASFSRYADVAEGELSRLKAALVSEASLAEAARRIGLGEFLLLDRGEEAGGGRSKPSLLADAFEALVAAVYLEGGVPAARSLLTVSLLGPALEAAGRGEFLRDYKSSLQERVQREPGVRLTYRVEEERGPDHDKLFCVGVFLDGRLLGRGTGRCKREAEQEAAQAALETLEGLSGQLSAAAYAEAKARLVGPARAAPESVRGRRPARRRRSARRGRKKKAPAAAAAGEIASAVEGTAPDPGQGST